MASFYHLARAPVAVKKKRKRAEGKSDNVLLFASHFIVVIFFCFILFLGGGGTGSHSPGVKFDVKVLEMTGGRKQSDVSNRMDKCPFTFYLD